MSAPLRDPDRLSWKIGRYDAVCQLATGGMAEIVLARLHGPSGFQRPVVIKRMLPHLARSPEFVTMFLDEARIVAGIRHPNVVHVHELGHENDELFLVMEYLEGEPASVIVPRLRKNDARLPFELAAFVTAEACAGLHAAHELTDDSGQPLNVVHRDISPQNIFVTYSGAVKVLDFGIAMAADRVTRTETGQFKGKFEYSSPEQCVGLALDRRSDIFSLGIFLYELSTLTRLFKRGSHMLTMRAICESPIVPPHEVVPGYPRVLSDVVMRALERRPKARYQTALEMRRALLTAMKQISSDVAPEETLGKRMHDLFPDRMREKEAMLRGAETGAPVHAVPATETDIDIEVPLAFEDALPADSAEADALDSRLEALLRDDAQSGATPFATAAVPSRRSWSVPLLLLGGGVIGAAIAVGAVSRHSTPSPSPLAVSASAAPSALASGATPSGIAATPSAATSASATSVAPSASVVVHVETSPSGSHVLVNGVDRGTTPADVSLARDTKKVTLDLRKDGFRPISQSIVPNEDQKLVLTLIALPAKHPATDTKPGSPYHRFD